MAVNKVDYEVLTTGVSTYGNQAEAINEALNALVTMNGQLQEGWTNQTADAFIQRFEDEYKPALENVIEAVQSISDYIQSYICKHVRMMMLQAQQLLEANFISSPNETISNRITVANGKLKNRARGEKNDQISML